MASPGGEEMKYKFAKAVFAFLVLPGTVGFLIPLGLAPNQLPTEPVHWLGIPLLVTGVFILLWCVRDFYVAGTGTLAPWAPPRDLVRTGLYRYSRNPMYLGVSTILIGWTVLFLSRTLLIYTVAVAIMFHLRVILGEEPWLARTHGAKWEAYKGNVPRWFL